MAHVGQSQTLAISRVFRHIRQPHSRFSFFKCPSCFLTFAVLSQASFIASDLCCCQGPLEKSLWNRDLTCSRFGAGNQLPVIQNQSISHVVCDKPVKIERSQCWGINSVSSLENSGTITIVPLDKAIPYLSNSLNV